MINPGEIEILLVEDSAIEAEILRRKLVQEGYQVSVAENGAKALAMIRQAKPSLIISDIVMPIIDGYKPTYGGETHRITSGRREILNLLISTYENAAEQNRQLIKVQNNLRAMNQELDIKLSELQESEDRFRLLVQTAEMIIIYGKENKIVFSQDCEMLRATSLVALTILQESICSRLKNTS